MPTYDYDCKSCGPFDALRQMNKRDQALECPDCGALSARIFAFGSIFRVSIVTHDERLKATSVQRMLQRCPRITTHLMRDSSTPLAADAVQV